MRESKLKPVLLSDQDALKIVYQRASAEHRRLSNAAAAYILESATIPQHRSFKSNIIEKSTKND